MACEEDDLRREDVDPEQQMAQNRKRRDPLTLLGSRSSSWMR